MSTCIFLTNDKLFFISLRILGLRLSDFRLLFWFDLVNLFQNVGVVETITAIDTSLTELYSNNDSDIVEIFVISVPCESDKLPIIKFSAPFQTAARRTNKESF